MACNVGKKILHRQVVNVRKKIISPEVWGKKSLTQTKSPIPPSKLNARPLSKFFSRIDGLPISIGMELRYKNLLAITSLQRKVTKIV